MRTEDVRPWTQDLRDKPYPPEEDTYSGPEDFDLAEYRRRKELARKGAEATNRRIRAAADPWSVMPDGAA